MRRATLAMLSALAMACSAYVTQAPYDPGIVSVVGVKVSPQVVQLAAVGDTRQLVVTVMPANATDRAVVWESTDSSVVSVDSAGVISAKAQGVGVFITAVTHDGHFQASVNVGVNP